MNISFNSIAQHKVQNSNINFRGIPIDGITKPMGLDSFSLDPEDTTEGIKELKRACPSASYDHLRAIAGMVRDFFTDPGKNGYQWITEIFPPDEKVEISVGLANVPGNDRFGINIYSASNNFVQPLIAINPRENADVSRKTIKKSF